MKRKKIKYKDVEEERYSIDEKGRIIDIKTGEKIRGEINKKGKFVIQLKRKNVSNNRFSYPILISRLMVHHFTTENLNQKTVVNMDFNVRHNSINNLMIVSTKYYNSIIKYLFKLHEYDHNSKNRYFSKLEIIKICESFEDGMSNEDILKKLNIRKNNKLYDDLDNILDLMYSRVLYTTITKKFEWESNPYDSIMELLKKKRYDYYEVINALELEDNKENKKIYCNALYNLYGKYSLMYLQGTKIIKIKKIK